MLVWAMPSVSRLAIWSRSVKCQKVIFIFGFGHLLTIYKYIIFIIVAEFDTWNRFLTNDLNDTNDRILILQRAINRVNVLLYSTIQRPLLRNSACNRPNPTIYLTSPLKCCNFVCKRRAMTAAHSPPWTHTQNLATAQTQEKLKRWKVKSEKWEVRTITVGGIIWWRIFCLILR